MTVGVIGVGVHELVFVVASASVMCAIMVVGDSRVVNDHLLRVHRRLLRHGGENRGVFRQRHRRRRVGSAG